MGLLDRSNSSKMDVFLKGTHGYWEALNVSMYGFPIWKYFPTKTWSQFTKFEDAIYEYVAPSPYSCLASMSVTSKRNALKANLLLPQQYFFRNS